MSSKKIAYLTACALLLALLLAGFLSAQIHAAPNSPLAGYAISWWTVDNGGRASQGGPYSLNGTMGQADAGKASAGVYTLYGGFWSGIASLEYRTFIPVIRR